jgi:hypothetical protein
MVIVLNLAVACFNISYLRVILMDELIYRQLQKSKFYHPEVTEVIHETNQLEGMIAGAIKVVEKGFDMIWDRMMFNFHFHHLHDGYEAMERLIDEKNLKIRLIVEAIPENIEQVNSITNYEIRHLDDIKSNFGILDGRAYVVSIFNQGSSKPQQAFFSNSRTFIDKQQALFDRLWEIAVPLDLRNKELKLREYSNMSKTLNKIDEIRNTLYTLMETCKKELIVFSSMDILENLTCTAAFWQRFTETTNRKVLIKILTDRSISKLQNEGNRLNKTLQTNFIQIEYSDKLGYINECAIISDAKVLLKIINNDCDCVDRFTASLTYDPDQILIQEILFEKHWNEVENLALLNQRV